MKCSKYEQYRHHSSEGEEGFPQQVGPDLERTADQNPLSQVERVQREHN